MIATSLNGNKPTSIDGLNNGGTASEEEAGIKGSSDREDIWD